VHNITPECHKQAPAINISQRNWLRSFYAVHNLPPTSITVNFHSHTDERQLLLRWTSSVMVQHIVNNSTHFMKLWIFFNLHLRLAIIDAACIVRKARSMKWSSLHLFVRLSVLSIDGSNRFAAGRPVGMRYRSIAGASTQQQWRPTQLFEVNTHTCMCVTQFSR